MKSSGIDHFIHGQRCLLHSAGSVTGDFAGMLVITDTVVANMTWANGYLADNSWATLGTIPAQTYIPGHFTQIQLTSGKVILAKHP